MICKIIVLAEILCSARAFIARNSISDSTKDAYQQEYLCFNIIINLEKFAGEFKRLFGKKLNLKTL